eukprot:300226-Chlamydomonas_euryale.AAC.1
MAKPCTQPHPCMRDKAAERVETKTQACTRPRMRTVARDACSRSHARHTRCPPRPHRPSSPHVCPHRRACAILKMFFFRSMILSLPPAIHVPTSPVCSQPSSSSTSRVCTSSAREGRDCVYRRGVGRCGRVWGGVDAETRGTIEACPSAGDLLCRRASHWAPHAAHPQSRLGGALTPLPRFSQ